MRETSPDGGDEESHDRDGTADSTGDPPVLIVSERQTEEGLLVSVCDGDVLGETFEQGEVSLTVTEEFYGGDSLAEEEVVESLGRAAVANIVGVRAVALAVEAGFVEEANVLEVGETRHAQFLRI